MLASPLEQDTKVDITDLTHASVAGNGVFDVLMRAVNAHLQKEWSANRLKGTEYSTVYLGALESTMNASLQFLLARDKTNAELDILKQQLVNLKVEEANAIKQGLQLVAQTAQTTQQTSNLLLEAGNITKQGTVLTNQAAQIAQETIKSAAQTSLITKQELQVVAETLNVPKQGQLIDANRLQTEAQTTIANTQSAQDLLVKQAQVVSMGKDDEVKVKQALQIAAQTSLTNKQELQVVAETLNVPKQGELIDAQKNVQTQQKLNLEAQKLNIPKEGALVDAQKSLTDQKLLTEQDALLTATAQRFVLMAQANGFNADAKQKAAEILLKGFSVIATTNDLTEIQSAAYGVSTTKVKAALDALVP